MKISIELNSLDELTELQKIYVASNNILEDFFKEEVAKQFKEMNKEEKAPAKEEKKPKKTTKKAKTEEAPAEEPDEANEDVEDLKVKARKLLAKVNKKTGENTAKAWINEMAYDSLSDIKVPDTLNVLIAKAEEYLDA